MGIESPSRRAAEQLRYLLRQTARASVNKGGNTGAYTPSFSIWEGRGFLLPCLPVAAPADAACEEASLHHIRNPERGITMTLYDELVARGLIAQVTDEEEIKEPDQQWQGDLLYRL